jgi:hypothetical protein
MTLQGQLVLLQRQAGAEEDNWLSSLPDPFG